MKNKALVLLSGGLDSVTLLAHILNNKEFEEVETLNIFYGQKNSKEQKCSQKIANYYSVPITFIDLSKIFENSNSTLISKNESDVSIKNDSGQIVDVNEHGEAKTYVPFRNGVFLSVATSIAYSKNCGTIFYAIIHGLNDIEGAAYPDCSKNFIKSQSSTISYGTGGHVKLLMPFKNIQKSEVLKLGHKLKVPYELTWSCYTDYPEPCGKCHACIERGKAFSDNKLIDPLIIKKEVI